MGGGLSGSDWWSTGTESKRGSGRGSGGSKSGGGSSQRSGDERSLSKCEEGKGCVICASAEAAGLLVELSMAALGSERTGRERVAIEAGAWEPGLLGLQMKAHSSGVRRRSRARWLMYWIVESGSGESWQGHSVGRGAAWERQADRMARARDVVSVDRIFSFFAF